MARNWNYKKSFALYLTIAIAGAILVRFKRCSDTTNEPPPIGKTIHFMPIEDKNAPSQSTHD